MTAQYLEGARTIRERAQALTAELGGSLHDELVGAIYAEAGAIAGKAVTSPRPHGGTWDRTLDDLLTSRWFGFPLMLAILAGIFFLTIEGSNIPSQFIASGLFWVHDQLIVLFQSVGAPSWLTGFLINGVFRGLAWVVAVMLPPMAIFFPVFTFLEDFGYLPRVAFNLDRMFQWSGAHGKQALTMGMGFGCNAAGVISTRIIDSPRERLIAIVTNNFVPCNGRWPLIIMLASLFVAAQFPPGVSSLAAASTVVGVTLFGVLVTLLVSRFLSRTWLKGTPSSFQLELPPYRRPQLMRILYTSLIDRTIFVLGRAVMMAAPAGGLIWILGNVYVDGISVMAHAAAFLNPAGQLLGLDGVILLAYIIAIPANEIIVPTIIMAYTASGQMVEFESMASLKALFEANGWSVLTAVSLMLFSLLHYPCSTTSLTIYKETGSLKWTIISNVLPLTIAVAVCFVVAQSVRLLGLA
jgi:ferrous iron transport protein B